MTQIFIHQWSQNKVGCTEKKVQVNERLKNIYNCVQDSIEKHR